MIINLRGTSGSGKTTVVRGIMSKGRVSSILGHNGKPEAYRICCTPVSRPVYAIGNYEQTCGGVDTVDTQDEICNLIRNYAIQGHVLVEGLLMSHLFSRYAFLDRELHAKGTTFIWAFLDTPLDLCIQRVSDRREARRLARANPPPFKPLDPKNTSDKWRDMRRLFTMCGAENIRNWKGNLLAMAKLDARWVDHQKAVEQVFDWLAKPDFRRNRVK